MTIVRELRKTRGLSLRAVCQKLGYKDPIMSSVEVGKRATWPKLQNALADFYGVPLSELFEEQSGIAKRSQSSLIG